MARIVGLRRVFEERCLRHRELDGHATPKLGAAKRRAARLVNVFARRRLAKSQR